MSTSTRKLGHLLLAGGILAAYCAAPARCAEPSDAMLGIIPIDEGGQVLVNDVYVGRLHRLRGCGRETVSSPLTGRK